MLLQTDPGVPIVYAGFGALMLTTCISYLSHSQVKFLCIKNFQAIPTNLILMGEFCSIFPNFEEICVMLEEVSDNIYDILELQL